MWDTHSDFYNTLSSDLEDPLTLADSPSSQMSGMETRTHTRTYSPFPNYRVPGDETLKQHFSVFLKKKVFLIH